MHMCVFNTVLAMQRCLNQSTVGLHRSSMLPSAVAGLLAVFCLPVYQSVILLDSTELSFFSFEKHEDSSVGVGGVDTR